MTRNWQQIHEAQQTRHATLAPLLALTQRQLAHWAPGPKARAYDGDTVSSSGVTDPNAAVSGDEVVRTIRDIEAALAGVDQNLNRLTNLLIRWNGMAGDYDPGELTAADRQAMAAAASVERRRLAGQNLRVCVSCGLPFGQDRRHHAKGSCRKCYDAARIETDGSRIP